VPESSAQLTRLTSLTLRTMQDTYPEMVSALLISCT